MKAHYDWKAHPEIPARLDRAVERLIRTRNAEILQPFALYLGMWKADTSRKLPRRLVADGTVREQAEICLRWISDHHGLRQLLHVVAPTAETSMGACCADVRLDGVCIFHCRPSATPVEFDSAGLPFGTSADCNPPHEEPRNMPPDGFGVPLAAL
jgi:hypothetical protein